MTTVEVRVLGLERAWTTGLVGLRRLVRIPSLATGDFDEPVADENSRPRAATGPADDGGAPHPGCTGSPESVPEEKGAPLTPPEGDILVVL